MALAVISATAVLPDGNIAKPNEVNGQLDACLRSRALHRIFGARRARLVIGRSLENDRKRRFKRLSIYRGAVDVSREMHSITHRSEERRVGKEWNSRWSPCLR